MWRAAHGEIIGRHDKGTEMIAAISLSQSVAFAACVLALLGTGLLVVVLGRLDGHDDADDSEPGDGNGGLPTGGPPWPCDSGGEPPWWPDFERQFADYVAPRTPAARP